MQPIKKHKLQWRTVRCALTYLLIVILSAIIGILSIVYDFQELALQERIKVRPGLPAYEMWKTPSDIGLNIGIKVYLFAVENPDEFLSNPKAKLKLKEIGPIIYKKHLRHKNIIFHDVNSTLSFSQDFDLEYDDKSPELINQTITIVNPLILSLAAMAHDMFFARMAFNLIAKSDHVFLNRTVYEVLWNNSSPIFDLVKDIPFAAPRKNAGIMWNAFYPEEHRYNVNYGAKHGYENFFKINTFNGLPWINVYNENFVKHCPVSLKGATEGTGLPPHMRKDYVINAYTKNLCRTYPMIYNSTVNVGGLEAYRYVLADEIYTRMENSDLDCFKKTGEMLLPNGLSDSSKCAFGLPVATSNPHFWGYHGEWENYLDGLKPNVDSHGSYILVEPTAGIQLAGIARIQSNMPLPRFDYFSSNIRRFSGMIVPQFWMEYFMINDNLLIRGMLFMFLFLPVIQVMVVALALATSVFAAYKSVSLMVYISRISITSKEQNMYFEEQLLWTQN